MNKYYLKELKFGKYQIINKLNNLAVYDKERDGRDMPLEFAEYDDASRACDELNNE